MTKKPTQKRVGFFERKNNFICTMDIGIIILDEF